MDHLASFVPALLAVFGAVLAVVGVGLASVGHAGRHKLRGEIDRLHDELWELREATAGRDRAEAASEAKSRFLANVSHEVRTPLNGILGMAELLAGTALDAEQQTYVAAIRSSGSALASLIEEILDFSKIEAGKVDLAFDSFEVAELVEGVTELLAPRAQGKGIGIASTIAADVPARVIGDPVRLRQILLNLAGNGVKFTETGGVGIRVTRLAGDGGLVRFDVMDTGPGIPAANRAAIFEDFQQVDAAPPNPQGGAGLGLAISKRLAEMMGGALTLAESDEGTEARIGSVFSLLLPLRGDPEAAPRVKPVALAGKTALVVGASSFEAPFLAVQLREAGVVVTHVADLEAALRHLTRQPPIDFAFIDCALGDAATATLGRAARVAGASRTIVLFSPFERRAFGSVSARGFDGWLVKPARQESLFALLTMPPAQKPSAVASVPPYPRPDSPLKVLLAEDNEINALLATRFLEKLGAVVTRAPDGLAALTLFEAALDAGQPFDALLLDIRMPGLDGLEVARRARLAESARRARPTRIVISSADARGSEHRVFAQAGIDAFLTKPVSFAEVRRVFDRQSETEVVLAS